jgi:hypothetical protein
LDTWPQFFRISFATGFFRLNHGWQCP